MRTSRRESPGLLGRPIGRRRVVFLHGRWQQGRDPIPVRAAWAGGLARGLAAGGLAPLDPAEVWFPFYGDALIEALDVRERALASDGATVAEAAAPVEDSTRAVYAELINEGAGHAGMPAQERWAAHEAEFAPGGGRSGRCRARCPGSPLAAA